MHPSLSLNLICFGGPTAGAAESGRPLAQNLEFCVDAGFHQVGLTWASIQSAGLDRTVDLLHDSGLRVATILTTRMLTLPVSSRWPGELAALEEKLDFAALVGADSVYGPVGPAGSLEWNDATAAFGRAIGPVVAHAERVGVPLILESTMPLYADLDYVHSFRDAVEVARASGLGVCLDLFPTWQERDLLDTVGEAMSMLHLVQVGDFPQLCRSVPDRVVPGDGVIPLPTIIAGIVERGYQGAFDIELTGPRIVAEGVDQAAVRAGTYLSELLVGAGK